MVDSKLRATLLGWVQAKVILIVVAGFSCSSFSKARNMPGGPPPLRDSQNVAGHPDLHPGDAEKVRIGNSFARWCVKLIRCGVRTWTVGLLENPYTSWAWQLSEMLELRCARHRFQPHRLLSMGLSLEEEDWDLVVPCGIPTLLPQVHGPRSVQPHRSSAPAAQGPEQKWSLLDAHCGAVPRYIQSSHGSGLQ